MSREPAAAPESDRFEDAPHPRETLAFFGHAAAEQALLTAYRQDRMAQAWILGGLRASERRLSRGGSCASCWPIPTRRRWRSRRAEFAVRAGDAPAARRIAAMALADVFPLRRSWNEKTKKFFTEIRIDDVREIIHAFHQASGNRRLARRHRRLRRRPQPLQRQRAARTDRGAAGARAVLADRASAGTPAADHPLAVSQADAGAAARRPT